MADAVDRAVLKELNLARTQPQAYAEIVSGRAPALGISPRAVAETVRFLKRQKPVGPLAESAGLTEAALAHVLRDKTEAAYRRATALEKRRMMMDAWANHCASTPGGAVVALRPRA